MIGSRIALPLGLAFACAIAALTVAPRAFDAEALLFAQDEPALLADHALDRSFDSAVAAREIQSALAADDADLAMSFLELARDRDIAVDPALAARVEEANSSAAAAARAAGSFGRGFITGEPDDLVGFAGTAVGDLFVFGDIRDAVREGSRVASGQQADELILGLACVGLAVTAGTYFSGGVATPARIGFSVALRAAREAVKVEKAQGLMRVAGDVGRMQTKAGTRAAVDGLKIAEGPRDVSRLARLADSKGTRTRAIIKLFGRGAILLTTSAFGLFTWILSALIAVLSFCSACKRTAERATERAIERRKARRALQRQRFAAMTVRA